MTATPMLEDNIFGRYQKKISDSLYLDAKDSDYILAELKAFSLEVVDEFINGDWMGDSRLGPDYITQEDHGDQNDQ